MLRFVIALPLALVITTIAIALAQASGQRLFPVGAEMEAAVASFIRQDAAGGQAIIDAQPTVPLGAYLSVIAAWCIGAIVGAWTAARIAGRSALVFGVAIGLLVTLAATAQMATIPHPAWMWPLGIVFPLFCGALTGALTGHAPRRTA